MKLPWIERYNATKHGTLGPCPWQITAQQLKPSSQPCVLEFVVNDPCSPQLVGYCRTHFGTQLENDQRLRAALLLQLAEKVL